MAEAISDCRGYLDKNYNTNIKIERARVDRLPMQYLYSMGDSYVFMNNEIKSNTGKFSFMRSSSFKKICVLL